MPLSPGLWIDIDPSTALFPEPKLAINAGADGVVEIAGSLRQWQVLVEVDSPVPGPGHIGIRGCITVSTGRILVALFGGGGAVLHQFLHDGRKGDWFEEFCFISEEISHIALRNGVGADTEVDISLRSLTVQQTVGALKPWPLDELWAPVSAPLPTDMPHHPALTAVPAWSGLNPSGVTVNWVGARTDLRFLKGFAAPPPGMAAPPLPELSEEYFEWIVLAEAIAAASGRFTMVELGAGYGRWMIDALGILRQQGRRDLTPYFIGVEAEPTHFAWMADHFRNNGLDPVEHRLVQGAVSAHDGTVRFAVGDADAWYGQSIIDDTETGVSSAMVPAYSLSTLLRDVDCVDLLDIDIQGAEAEVCVAGARTLDEKVRRIYIGTHGAAIERELRQLFLGLGWSKVFDFRMGRPQPTPFGRVMFGDGVQCWLNPRL